MDSKQHVDNVLANLRTLFEKAAARIDALKPGEKIPATTLAADLAKELGMTGPQLYPTLKFSFDGYPGVAILKGAHGGIYKLLPNESLDDNGKIVKKTADKPSTDGNDGTTV